MAHPKGERNMLGHPDSKPPILSIERWHAFAIAGGVLTLVVYMVLVWLDLPHAAGLRYEPPPAGQGLVPAHWWDEMQGLRGWAVNPRGWEWPLMEPAPILRWVPLIAVGLFLFLLLWVATRVKVRSSVALATLVLLGYFEQLAALWLKPESNASQLLFERIASTSFTGYFTSASRITEVKTFFGGYASAIASSDPAVRLCSHCITHPPGPIVFYWVPLQIVQALPTTVQQGLRDWLMGILSLHVPSLPFALTPAQIIVAVVGGHVVLVATSCIVLPLYGMARIIVGQRLALHFAALGLLVPGIMLMSPEFDQLYAVAASVLLYLTVSGLRSSSHQVTWGLTAGVWFAGCLYWSFGLLALAAPIGALALLAATGTLFPNPIGTGSRRQQALHWAAAALIGALLPWLLLWSVGGLDLPSVALLIDQHQEQITEQRPYAVWLVFNLVDFLQFQGLPLTALSLYSLLPNGDIEGAINDRLKGSRALQLLAATNPYSLVFWGTLILLDLSGEVRAETGRLWLFLVPLALAGIMQLFRKRGTGIHALYLLLAGQFATVVLLGARWLTP